MSKSNMKVSIMTFVEEHRALQKTLTETLAKQSETLAAQSEQIEILQADNAEKGLQIKGLQDVIRVILGELHDFTQSKAERKLLKLGRLIPDIDGYEDRFEDSSKWEGHFTTRQGNCLENTVEQLGKTIKSNDDHTSSRLIELERKLRKISVKLHKTFTGVEELQEDLYNPHTQGALLQQKKKELCL